MLARSIVISNSNRNIGDHFLDRELVAASPTKYRRGQKRRLCSRTMVRVVFLPGWSADPDIAARARRPIPRGEPGPRATPAESAAPGSRLGAPAKRGRCAGARPGRNRVVRATSSTSRAKRERPPRQARGPPLNVGVGAEGVSPSCLSLPWPALQVLQPAWRTCRR